MPTETTESPLLDQLNPIQREAVLHTEGPVLIVAGAGSGKTRALTHRVAYLIREKNVAPGAILAITFTNKAAQEMAERVEGLLGTRISRAMWILTFHSTCARILRREHNHLGLPSTFSIYDQGDTERVLAMVLRSLNIDPKRFPPRAMAAAIGKAKDHLIGPADFEREAGNFYETTVAKVYADYERRLRAAGAVDFDDLITETAGLFRDHSEVLDKSKGRKLNEQIVGRKGAGVGAAKIYQLPRESTAMQTVIFVQDQLETAILRAGTGIGEQSSWENLTGLSQGKDYLHAGATMREGPLHPWWHQRRLQMYSTWS